MRVFSRRVILKGSFPARARMSSLPVPPRQAWRHGWNSPFLAGDSWPPAVHKSIKIAFTQAHSTGMARRAVQELCYLEPAPLFPACPDGIPPGTPSSNNRSCVFVVGCTELGNCFFLPSQLQVFHLFDFAEPQPYLH